MKNLIQILTEMGCGMIRDNCPFHPEDKDGIQDEDGCPDPDSMTEWQEVLLPKTDDSTDDNDAKK